MEELGLEAIIHPVKKVRVHFHAGHWYVEFQRKPKYFIDGWWWFDDSKFADYVDAYARAQALVAQGGTKEIRHKTLVFEV
jgi:hypothetical protein